MVTRKEKTKGKPNHEDKTVVQILKSTYASARLGWLRRQVQQKQETAFYEFIDEVIKEGMAALKCDKD